MDEIEITRGSGNVFADLGFENPDEELLKAQLIIRIRTLIKDKKLTQVKAAEILQIKQPDVSSLTRGRVAGFSLERLFSFVRRLGDDVEITIRHRDGPIRQPEAIPATGRMLLKVA